MDTRHCFALSAPCTAQVYPAPQMSILTTSSPTPRKKRQATESISRAKLISINYSTFNDHSSARDLHSLIPENLCNKSYVNARFLHLMGQCQEELEILDSSARITLRSHTRPSPDFQNQTSKDRNQERSPPLFYPGARSGPKLPVKRCCLLPFLLVLHHARCMWAEHYLQKLCLWGIVLDVAKRSTSLRAWGCA